MKRFSLANLFLRHFVLATATATLMSPPVSAGQLPKKGHKSSGHHQSAGRHSRSSGTMPAQPGAASGVPGPSGVKSQVGHTWIQGVVQPGTSTATPTPSNGGGSSDSMHRRPRWKHGPHGTYRPHGTQHPHGTYRPHGIAPQSEPPQRWPHFPIDPTPAYRGPQIGGPQLEPPTGFTPIPTQRRPVINPIPRPRPLPPLQPNVVARPTPPANDLPQAEPPRNAVPQPIANEVPTAEPEENDGPVERVRMQLTSEERDRAQASTRQLAGEAVDELAETAGRVSIGHDDIDDPNDEIRSNLTANLEDQGFDADELTRFYDAALNGDFDTVRQLMRNHGLNPDGTGAEGDGSDTQFFTSVVRQMELGYAIGELGRIVAGGGSPEEIRAAIERVGSALEGVVAVPYGITPEGLAQIQSATEVGLQKITDLTNLLEVIGGLEQTPDGGWAFGGGGDGDGPGGADDFAPGGGGGGDGPGGADDFAPGGGGGGGWGGGWGGGGSWFDWGPGWFLFDPGLAPGVVYWIGNDMWLYGGGGDCGCVSLQYGTPAIVGLPIPSVEPVPSAPDCDFCGDERIVIVNPAQSGGDVNFVLDNESVLLAAGDMQEFAANGAVIQFNRGDARGNAKYRLVPGSYKFAVTDNGWELYKTTFKATLDNTANDSAFHLLVGDEPTVVPAGEQYPVESAYPIRVSFDTGTGGEPVTRELASNDVYTIGINQQTGGWDLFPGDAAASGVGSADDARLVATANGDDATDDGESLLTGPEQEAGSQGGPDTSGTETDTDPIDAPQPEMDA